MDINEIKKIVDCIAPDDVKELMIIEHIARHQKAFDIIKSLYESQMRAVRFVFKESVEMLDLINRIKDIEEPNKFEDKINSIIQQYKILNNDKPKLS